MTEHHIPRPNDEEIRVHVTSRLEEIDYADLCGNAKALARSYWQELRLRTQAPEGETFQASYRVQPPREDVVHELELTSDGAAWNRLVDTAAGAAPTQYDFDLTANQVALTAAGQTAPIEDSPVGAAQLSRLSDLLFEACEAQKSGGTT